MYTGPAQNNAHAGRAGIDLSDHLRLLVCCAPNHEDDDVLGLIPRVSAAFEEWILQLLQTAFNEVLKGHFESWRVLRVDVLHPFQALETVPGAGEEGGGFK